VGGDIELGARDGRRGYEVSPCYSFVVIADIHLNGVSQSWYTSVGNYVSV